MENHSNKAAEMPGGTPLLTPCCSPKLPHIMPSAIFTCSRYGSTWGGLMGSGDKDQGEDTDFSPHSWHPHRPPYYALKDGQTGGVLSVAPRTNSTHSQCLGQESPECQVPPQPGAGQVQPWVPHIPPGSWPPAENLGGGQAVSSFSPPSLSKMKNLILVFTAPPRWINPFLVSPSPGKSCESNAGPSGSHCSNSCFSPAALCKVL